MPGEAEAPGSKPDPVETTVKAVGVAELASKMEDALITPTEEEAARLGEDGFVSAILDGRFFPSEPGGEHSGDEPHVVSLVMQFDSDAGATDAVDLLYTDGLEPCPETCAFDIAEFEVDGIPNAKGAQRIATQEALDQVGDRTTAPRRVHDLLRGWALRLRGELCLARRMMFPNSVPRKSRPSSMSASKARLHRHKYEPGVDEPLTG